MNRQLPRPLTERLAVVVALLGVLAVNWLANAVTIAGRTTGEVSALYESYFTPAGFTFAIWAVIYAGLSAYAVYQCLPARRDEAQLVPIGRLFIVNCALNAAWLFAWHYQQLGLSLLLMAGILLTLVLAYRHLGAWGQASLWVRLPFSIYLAWICVASLANASAWQTALGLNDALLGQVHWTLAKLALAAAVGAVVGVARRDPAFVLVIAWAAWGIAVKQASVPEVHGAALTIALLGLLLAALVILSALLRRRGPAV